MTTSPASMGGPLSEAAFVEAVGRYSLDQIRAYLAGPPVVADERHRSDTDRMAWLLDRVDRLEGQLATARALHRPERRYTPDDGETSYATYSEAADASFDGTGRPAMVTFFEVCSHCASIEMAEGCDHQYKESLWPCKEGVALGLDGGGTDA